MFACSTISSKNKTTHKVVLTKATTKPFERFVRNTTNVAAGHTTRSLPTQTATANGPQHVTPAIKASILKAKAIEKKIAHPLPPPVPKKPINTRMVIQLPKYVPNHHHENVEKNENTAANLNPTQNPNANAANEQCNKIQQLKHKSRSEHIRARIWNRRDIKEHPMAHRNEAKLQDTNNDPPKSFNQMGIQTNESEILNRELIVGDIKLLCPSRSLLDEIDRKREETKRKVLVNTERTFEEHSQDQERHLTGLKEFLERATVTKRTRRARSILEKDRKLINSMDILLNREIPKTESISDIRSRLKQKEQELLQLFDTVQTVQNASVILPNEATEESSPPETNTNT